MFRSKFSYLNQELIYFSQDPIRIGVQMGVQIGVQRRVQIAGSTSCTNPKFPETVNCVLPIQYPELIFLQLDKKVNRLCQRGQYRNVDDLANLHPLSAQREKKLAFHRHCHVSRSVSAGLMLKLQYLCTSLPICCF